VPDNHEALARQNSALTRQLLEWIAGGTYTYAEALETWRSSCPRHTIWEDALGAGLIDCRDGRLVVTSAGRALLQGQPRDR
jgi:hypothetical protein